MATAQHLHYQTIKTNSVVKPKQPLPINSAFKTHLTLAMKSTLAI